MSDGHWWLESKTYLHSRPPPNWTNRSDCYPATSNHRYQYDRELPIYDAAVRTFELLARPRIDIAERESQALAVRGFAPGPVAPLEPCFLASAQFVELVQRLDPQALITTPIEQLVHGRPVESTYLLCDVAHTFSALDVIDRRASTTTLHVGCAQANGRHYWSIESGRYTGTKIILRPERLAGCRIFGLVLGAPGRAYQVVVADELAEMIFAARLPGLALTHTTGERLAPAYYEQFTLRGWEEIYPA